MPPFQVIIRLWYGDEGEDNVDRRAISVGAVGLGERVCRVGWVGVGGLGDPYQIYVRVGWGRGMRDIRNSPLTINLAANRLDETINLSSSSSEGGEVEVAEVEEEEDGEIQIMDVRTVDTEEEEV